MTYCKSSPTSSISRARLEDGRDSPLVENTQYK
jgi:hypothetical protein